ncbi:MAG: hypothetical protein E6L00_02340 [Thaumarchaeota archaeon]|nr:MAG: hypothetical protein E6L00_02340 [Nitrososphaerota archaeon]
MSTRSARWGRKKRYAIALIVAIIGISFAFYNVEQNSPYKTTKEWSFDSYKNNTVPDSFSYLQTDAQPGFWIIKSDQSAPSKPNVLAKLADNDTASAYHIQLMPDGVESTNSETSVQIKINSGEKTQAAGLIVRFVDTKHYFVLVADAANKTFSLCRDDPEKFLYLTDKQANVTADQWHTITVDVSAQGFAGYFDGKLLIKRYDQHYQNGQLGLWTKKDTEAYFDNLKIKY